MDKWDVTVVVPTHCGADLLPMSLAHLEVQTFPSARFEILVVDYGSPAPNDALERYSAGAPVRTRHLAMPGEGPTRARNAAARLAEGRWLLFLDEDLLAGPELVGNHVRVQEENAGSAVVLGRIQMHPQVDARIFTKRFRLSPLSSSRQQGPDLADWGFFNLSVPRSVFVDSGGFDEDVGVEGLQELALVWRLRTGGLAMVYASSAGAYTWRPARFADERRRQYSNGYSFHLLEEQIPEEARPLFPTEQHQAREYIDKVLQPLYRHLCDPMSETVRPFEYMSERVLCHDFHQGYRDAVAGRPPRFEGVLTGASPLGEPVVGANEASSDPSG